MTTDRQCQSFPLWPIQQRVSPISPKHRRSHRRKPRRASGGSWRRDPSCSRRGPASNWMTAQPNSNCCLGGVAGATPPENSCRRPETPSHSCSSSLTTPLRSDSECGGRHFSLFRVRVRSRIVQCDCWCCGEMQRETASHRERASSITLLVDGVLF